MLSRPQQKGRAGFVPPYGSRLGLQVWRIFLLRLPPFLFRKGCSQTHSSKQQQIGVSWTQSSSAAILPAYAHPYVRFASPPPTLPPGAPMGLSNVLSNFPLPPVHFRVSRPLNKRLRWTNSDTQSEPWEGQPSAIITIMGPATSFSAAYSTSAPYAKERTQGTCAKSNRRGHD